MCAGKCVSLFGAIVLVMTCLQRVNASLPANVGTLQFTPGDPAPSFSVPLLAEVPLSSNATLNSTQLSYSERATPLLPGPRSDFFPLLLVSIRQDDQFVDYMVRATESVDKFLNMGPSGCHFLFSVYDPPGHREPDQVGHVDKLSTYSLATFIRSRVGAAKPEVAQKWSGRLHFTNGSATDALDPDLGAMLAQWRTPQNVIHFKTLGNISADLIVSHLDVEYATGPWPSQVQSFTLAKVRWVVNSTLSHHASRLTVSFFAQLSIFTII